MQLRARRSHVPAELVARKHRAVAIVSPRLYVATKSCCIRICLLFAIPSHLPAIVLVVALKPDGSSVEPVPLLPFDVDSPVVDDCAADASLFKLAVDGLAKLLDLDARGRALRDVIANIYAMFFAEKSPPTCEVKRASITNPSAGLTAPSRPSSAPPSTSLARRSSGTPSGLRSRAFGSACRTAAPTSPT